MNPTPWRNVLDIGMTVLVAAGGCAVAWWSLRKSVDPARQVFKCVVSAGLLLGTMWVARGYPGWMWPILAVPVGDYHRRDVGAQRRLDDVRLVDQRD